MLVSVREVLQLSQRCFWAAGVPIGSAESIADHVWWTEAYLGSGLTTLHGLLDDVHDLNREAVTTAERRIWTTRLDGGGQPALVSGPVAADTGCAAARRHGLGLVSVTAPADDTLPTTGAIAHTAASRGLVCLVSHTDTEGTTTVVGAPADPQPLIARRQLGAPSAAHTALGRVIQGDRTDAPDVPLTRALFHGEASNQSATAEKRSLDRLLDRALDAKTDAAVPDAGYLVVVLDPSHPRYPDSLGRPVQRVVDRRAEAFSRVYRPTDITEHAETLLHEGVEVDEDSFRDIFEVSSEVLAPPFEGSHRGAGFDINE